MNANETKPVPSREIKGGTIKPGTLIRWHNGPIEFKEEVMSLNGRLVVRSFRSNYIPLEILILNFGEDAIEIL